MIAGSVMTWTVIDNGVPITLTFSRVAPSENSALVGTWEATSMLHDGRDFIAEGMTFKVTLTDAGTFVLEITGDLSDECDPGPDCIETGDLPPTAVPPRVLVQAPHCRTTRAVNSGPLSERRFAGGPCSANSSLSVCRTSSA